MHLALNMAKMAKGGFSPAAIQVTQEPMTRRHAKVREEKTRGVEFPGHYNLKIAME